MAADLPRPVTRAEHDLLESMLGHDFVGVEALRAQLRGLLARRGCLCGCGTIDLLPQGATVPRSTVRTTPPVTGQVRSRNGDVIGGVVLWLDDGLLDQLEVHWFDDPLPLPAVEDVEWQT